MMLGFLAIILFYGLCFGGLIKGASKSSLISFFRQCSIYHILIFFLACILFICFIIFWPMQNNYIYFWDYSGYWESSIYWTSISSQLPFGQMLYKLFESINDYEYNMFLPSVTMLPFSKTDFSFSSYVFINCIMFLLPSYIIQSCTAVKLVGKTKYSSATVFVIAFIVAIIFNNNYYSAFYGYIDCGFLLPLSAVMYLFVGYDFGKKNILDNILIDLLLIMAWISRRYIAVFIIGYSFALFVKFAFALKNNKSKSFLVNAIFNFIQLLICAFLILILCFPHFLYRYLFNNYSDSYSAYNSSIYEKILAYTNSFGFISIMIIVFVGMCLFTLRKNLSNYVAFVLMIILEILLFSKIQDMGIHHSMILNLPLYLILIQLIVLIGNNNIVNFLSHLFGVLIILNFVYAFTKFNIINDGSLIFSKKYEVLKRNDINTIYYLVNELNDLTYGTDKYIYVLASGTTLNSEIINKANMPYSFYTVPNLFETYSVDLRDGFPIEFLYSEYIVTTNPIQTHLSKGQEIITYLASGVMDSESYIGRHFKPVDMIQLDNGVETIIYEKISEFDENDLQIMRDYYTNIYPGYEEMFAHRIVLN